MGRELVKTKYKSDIEFVSLKIVKLPKLTLSHSSRQFLISVIG